MLSLLRTLSVALLAVTLLTVQHSQAQIETGTQCPCELQLVLRSEHQSDSSGLSNVSTPQLKSPSIAFQKSLFGTLVPLPTLIFTLPGIIVGPSLGYFYGDMPGRAWSGIGLRFLGVGGMVSPIFICWDCSKGERRYTLSWVLFLAGAGLTVGSTIYDLGDIKSAVRNHNEKLKRRGKISITPTYFTDAKATGLSLTLRF